MSVLHALNRISLPLAAALVAGGCSPRPGASPIQENPSSKPVSVAPGPAPSPSMNRSARSLVAARKAAVSGEHAPSPRTTGIDRILSHKTELRLTPDQVARLAALKHDSGERQKRYSAEIAEARRSAKQMASQSSHSGTVSLKAIRVGLTSAAAVERRLEAERASANLRAAQVLTPGQRELLKAVKG